MTSSLRAAREQRRLEFERQRDRELTRRAALSSLVPEAAEIAGRLERLVADATRRCVTAPAQANAVIEQATRERERLSAELKALLCEEGLPEDSFAPAYLCTRCRDTGRVGFPVLEDCECVRLRAAEILTERSGLSAQAGSFEESNLRVFSDELEEGETSSQRARMRRIFAEAQSYADAFPRVKKPNYFMCGSSGLGKTYLAQCIARRVTHRSIPTVMLHAGRLSDILRGYHLDLTQGGEMHNLLSVPLLILDDLGSEPMYENVTIPHMYTLLNQRKNAGLATIIITNLMPPEFNLRYTERVFSRAMDIATTQLVLFTGRDLRLKK